MKKEELLQQLSAKVSTGEITSEEIVRYLKIIPVKHEKDHKENSTHFSVDKILYVLGATIVVIGIIFFVSQIWDDIGSFGRISVTLGLGFVITAMGSVLLKNKPSDNIGLVFHFIGGMLIPGGALVTLSELSVGSVSLWPVALTFGAISAFYVLLNTAHKNSVLTFFSIANSTAFFYLTVEAIVEGPYYRHEDVYAYLTMVVGVSYVLLSQAFRDGWNSKLVGVLHFFGITGFLGAAFSQVFDSLPWQLLFFPLLIGGFWLAIAIKSRSFLAISTVFLIAHVSYITSEYFADSIGWPISLVFLGFIFIALGYMSINISKKYITK